MLFIVAVRRLLLFGCLLVACKSPAASDVDPDLAAAAGPKDALEVHAALEVLIQAGSATEKDREWAYDVVQGWDDGSAGYAFARAALAGRLAQLRGLAALGLVEETATWARKSIDRDPGFSDRAATRMLGTLYVLAGDRLEKGDSEEGLSLLEEVVAAFPDEPVNHLRLAEGYVSLGDPEGGYEGLCRAVAGRERLTPEERELLTGLIADAGGEEVLGCEAGV